MRYIFLDNLKCLALLLKTFQHLVSYSALTTPPKTPPQVPLLLAGPDRGRVPHFPSTEELWSNSPTCFEQLFCLKVFSEEFHYLQFGFVIFWQKSVGVKAALKMLVKLTPGFPSEVEHVGQDVHVICKKSFNCLTVFAFNIAVA